MLTFQLDILGDESEMSISYGTTQPVAHVGSQGGFLFLFFLHIEISQMVSLFDLIASLLLRVMEVMVPSKIEWVLLLRGSGYLVTGYM